MTPAIHCLKKAKIDFSLHEYDHDSGTVSYGREAALKLNIPMAQIFKTLVVLIDNKELWVAVVPVSGQLNTKAFARAAKAKKVKMAPRPDVERSTGYVLGGVSPLGQKKPLKTVIDASAQDFETIYVSAGRRGLQVALSPLDLQSLTRACFEFIAR